MAAGLLTGFTTPTGSVDLLASSAYYSPERFISTILRFG
jgi:hypothetical protein